MLTEFIYIAFMFVSYTTAAMKRRKIDGLIDSGQRLVYPLKQFIIDQNYIKSSQSNEKCFIYNLAIKLLLDFVMTILVTIFFKRNFV